jgi:formylmethanofuran dehydrogenase subunit E
MIEVKKIGIIRSKFNERTDPDEIRRFESTIEIDPEYEEGLYRINESEYVQVLFNFHLSEGEEFKLKGPIWDGQTKGVFASRSPKRPSGIGLTTVKLIERKGLELRVKGLDALNGSPVIDIKPYVPFLDEAEQKRIGDEYKKSKPRSEINVLNRTGDLKELLLKAGELHGHFCSGLSFGVMAGNYALNELGIHSEGMEELLAIIETNNCFSDGIQLVTGCSFGNNSLIYRDYGKTAVIMTRRKEEGLRLALKPDVWEILDEKYPEAKELFDKVVVNRKGDEQDTQRFMEVNRKLSFEVLDLDINKLFKIEKVRLDVPAYAPIFDNIICSSCGESIMASRAVKKDDKDFCIPCSGSEFFEMDGSGMKKINL